MQLKKLYSRRGDGGLQEWIIEIEDNKYRTVSGTVDGEKVTSGWTYCFGKNIGKANETTPQDQALREATAKWTKKKDKGYSEEISGVDNHDKFKPMLAHNYEDHKNKLFSDKHKGKVFSQAKLNGMRCIARADGLWTRNGKKIDSCPHIFEALKPLFAKYPNAVFDGELYNHELRHKLNKIMELVRKSILSQSDLDESAANIKYYIYDGINIGGLDNTHLYSSRAPTIKAAVFGIDNIKWTEYKEVHNQDELDSQYRQLLKDDFEGQMIRLDAPYQNKRTSKLLKRKEFQDAEYKVLDIMEGVGNWAGAAKSVLCQHEDGRTFSSNITGDYEYLVTVLQDKHKYIGKMATVKFFELTDYGIPQFPFVTVLDRDSAEG